MKILVIGGGGREHALAWKLKQSPKASQVFVAPGNAGTARDACLQNVPITDVVALREWAQANGIGHRVEFVTEARGITARQKAGA